MKRITIEVDDTHEDVMTVSAIGVSGSGINVTCVAFKIVNGDFISIDKDGKLTQKHCDSE